MVPRKKGGILGQGGTTGIQDLDEGRLERARVLLGGEQGNSETSHVE